MFYLQREWVQLLLTHLLLKYFYWIVIIIACIILLLLLYLLMLYIFYSLPLYSTIRKDGFKKMYRYIYIYGKIETVI